jgi:Lrp/AsnC family leucine-responsive transcriptional regulator
VSGRYDYLVRLACRDLNHYRELTNTWIDDVGLGVDKVVTSTELQTVKEFAGFPLMVRTTR